MLSQGAAAQPDAAGLSLLMEQRLPLWASWPALMREVLAKRLAAAHPGTVRGVGSCHKEGILCIGGAQAAGPTGGLGAAAGFMPFLAAGRQRAASLHSAGAWPHIRSWLMLLVALKHIARAQPGSTFGVKGVTLHAMVC